MITEQDLQEAIAECEGKRKPDASTCIKLAAFYTIKDNLYPQKKNLEEPQLLRYSASPTPLEPITNNTEIVVDGYGDTALFTAIEGRNATEVWSIINELMEALEVLNPRLYSGVLQKLHQL